MNKPFDIRVISDSFMIDGDELAAVLFPSIKFPSMALKRVLDGTQNLDLDQLNGLAAYLNIPLNELILIGSGYKAGPSCLLLYCDASNSRKVRIFSYSEKTEVLVYGDNKLLDIKEVSPDITGQAFINYLAGFMRPQEELL